MQVTDHRIVCNNEALHRTGCESIKFPAHEGGTKVEDVVLHGRTHIKVTEESHVELGRARERVKTGSWEKEK